MSALDAGQISSPVVFIAELLKTPRCSKEVDVDCSVIDILSPGTTGISIDMADDVPVVDTVESVVAVPLRVLLTRAVIVIVPPPASRP